MQRFIEATGDNRDKAIEAALRQLGMDRDDVSVEVLDNGRRGFLGIGATPARVRVTYEVPDEPAPAEPVPVPDPTPTPVTAVEKPVDKVENSVHKVENPVHKVENPVRKAEKERKPQKLSITTDDVTPRLVKPAPKDFVPEKKKEEHTKRERTRREKRPVTPSVPKERKLIPVSEECMKQAEGLAAGFIAGLLEKMGVEGTVTVLPQLECDQLRLEISGPDMGPVIGRRGDTLDAIQYLASLVLNNGLQEHVRLSVDTENYREKRAESLERLARKMAMKVVKSHRTMTLEPMNPYERRIIHAALQDYNGVTTYSTGSEPGRRVVIAPDGARNRK